MPLEATSTADPQRYKQATLDRDERVLITGRFGYNGFRAPEGNRFKCDTPRCGLLSFSLCSLFFPFFFFLSLSLYFQLHLKRCCK